MLTMRITPKARVRPAAMRNRSDAEKSPFRVWVTR
jgi:hypothetical protein